MVNFKFNFMPFNSESAREAGKKSKRGPSKSLEPNVQEKFNLFHEALLDDLLLNINELTQTEKVKLFTTMSQYILPKTKLVRDEFTLEKLHKWEQEPILDQKPNPIR